MFVVIYVLGMLAGAFVSGIEDENDTETIIGIIFWWLYIPVTICVWVHRLGKWTSS